MLVGPGLISDFCWPNVLFPMEKWPHLSMKTAFTTECHVYFTCCPTSRGARETRRSVLDARKGPTIIIDSWWLTTLHQLKMHHLKKIKNIWFHLCIFPYRVQANTNKIETTSISLIIRLLLVGLQGHNEIQQKTKKSKGCLCWIWWIGYGQLLSFFGGLKAIGSV